MRAAKNGLRSKIVHYLTEGEPRKAIIDSQSVKTASYAISRGFEVAKNAVEVYQSIEKFSADGGYRGTFVAQVNQFLKYEVEISMKIKSPGFKDRWVVERTFAWLNNSRSLSKDYEISIWTTESFVYISYLHTT